MKYFLWSFTDHDVASRLLISTPCSEKKRKDLPEVVARVSLDSVEGGCQLKIRLKF